MENDANATEERNRKIREGFVNSVKASAGKPWKEEGTRIVTAIWRGKKVSAELSPSDVVGYGPRIKGRIRVLVAAWLVATYGNRCAIQSVYCLTGDQPFLHPESADFDHIDGDNLNRMLKNLRLACASCNRHEQAKQNKAIKKDAILHRKSARTVGSAQEKIEREEATATPTSTGEAAERSGEEGVWSSREGFRSDRMTYRYRQKLFHPSTGVMRNEGSQKPLKAFADELEEDLNVGKAQTYEKYLRKDARVGYFRIFEGDGVEILERLAKPYPKDRLGIGDGNREDKPDV